MFFPLKYYGQYTRAMFPGLQIIKLFLHNSTQFQQQLKSIPRP